MLFIDFVLHTNSISMSQFTHLHVHTQYSILDGAASINKLISRAKELGMHSIAITDHGNMFGVKNFHEIALKNNIKPIIGCECYVARRTRHNKDSKEDRSGHHLVLLAKNEIGYHNLIKMVSYSYTEGMHYRPRIDKDLLEKYHEGVICSSACLGGEISKLIMSGDIEAAEKSVKWFHDIFKEDYYLELQLFKSKILGVGDDTYQSQLLVNRHLLEIGEKLGIKCIASNDVHFVNSEDSVAHDHLICLNTGKLLTDENRMKYSGEEYLKSTQEMLQLFPDNPELITNTEEIANKIEHITLNKKPFMPDFPIPEDFDMSCDRLKNSYKTTFISTLSQIKDAAMKEQLSSESDNIFALIDSCNSIDDLDKLVEHSGDAWDKEFDAVNKLPIAKQHQYLEYITFKGAEKRYPNMDSETRERLEFELSTIEKMGYPGYFLIVWDFIKAGRDMGVAVGPGRGSAAGSVVAYCLWITNIDPIKYDLLFERFLNPERISMPDIDIDFDDDGREKVMQYVVDKYGASKVAHIITYGKMGAKNAIRDVARVQNLSLPESIRLTKLIPEKINITIQEMFMNVDDLKKAKSKLSNRELQEAFRSGEELRNERSSENALVRNTLTYANTLEGSIRQVGVHACGVIIGKDDLENYVPVSIAKDTKLNIVQYDGHYVESIGLLKMDFLGLRTLSIIKECIKNIKISKGVELDIETICFEDEKTFQLYSNGDTTGIFQFESPGMKKHLKALQPNRFEDLIAMNALYRPGPMEYIPDFIDRKKGVKEIVYDMPNMDKYLKDTYGITVYQEQVMLLSQLLAGFTKGQADGLRKAMGKKLIKELDILKPAFIEGAVGNGYDREKCEKVWGDWEAFASYAFNKSHSTCYAHVSYQTAFLKAHYPSEFMAALLSRNFSDIKKISFFMDECKKMGRVVNGPDVNDSLLEFSVDKNENIRFGLSAIKGIGTGASESIIRERETNGKYKDLYDFVERLDSREVGKKVIENLIDAGAFDSLSGFNRSLFKYKNCENDQPFLDKLYNYGSLFREEKNASVNSLFGDFSDTSSMIQKPIFPSENGKEWSNISILNRERDLIGMYVSAHPLDDYRYLINKYATSSYKMFDDAEGSAGKSFSLAGVINTAEIMTTKKGTYWCKLNVSGDDGAYEFAIFGKDFDKFRQYYYANTFVCITGKIDKRFETDAYKPMIQSICSLQELNEQIKGIELTINNETLSEPLANELVKIFKSNIGAKTVQIRLYDKDERVVVTTTSLSLKIEPNSILINSIEKMGINYKLI